MMFFICGGDRGSRNLGVKGAGSLRKGREERVGDGIPKGAGVWRNGE